MSHVTITINTSNAAFHVQGNDDDHGTYDPGAALAEILRDLANVVEQQPCEDVALLDANGARVGIYAHHDDEEVAQ